MISKETSMLLFRYSNYQKYRFIDEHIKIIQQLGYVWMMKMGKKTMRKKGIGKLLLAKLIEITKQENKDEISLEVNEINEPAISLYSSFGFEILGRRKKYYNRENDAIIMTKKLV